ncbi:SigE family RNA polymerase sigma factor [Nocardioides nitrophenolicus]|uniref:SigE family RNA polymerase sigma factor n=1 Tax=Nocardioides nitrophenolicus TaxID=60489 RepID=UPI00195EC7DC|nr:SigE family RNA polymerase sigma factor [Nocardioides nitrophenolicus]MBM7516659.1 RNA polymerase sigma-70 factor (sigma-E family) [Nocardioides nitrophenolicus]
MIGRAHEREFEEFVRTSADGLVRTAYLLCGDAGHAEDLVQVTLLRTARRWRTARRNPRAYARRVLVNLTRDRWRNLARRPREAPLDADVPLLDEDGDHDALITAVRDLPHGQRAVVALRFLDGLSVEETAAALGCSTGTVKSQTHRALASLRRALTPTGGATS